MTGLGVTFHCPWTQTALTVATFDLDHLIPVSTLPFNDLWNLVPASRSHNQHIKGARLPSDEGLARAVPVLASTYEAYASFASTAATLSQDVRARFGYDPDPPLLARQVVALAVHIAEARNVPRYEIQEGSRVRSLIR